MKILLTESPNKIKKAIPKIESRIKVNVSVKGKTVRIEGNEFNEYTVEKIISAIDFGFETEDALLLLKENFNLEFINIKEHTPRKNFGEVRARLIGTEGKAKTTIETLTGSVIVVHQNRVGVIVDTEHLSQTIQGIVSLIRGSKHGNVFAYLEKQNANLRLIDEDDLGLRNPKKDLSGLS